MIHRKHPDGNRINPSAPPDCACPDAQGRLDNRICSACGNEASRQSMGGGVLPDPRTLRSVVADMRSIRAARPASAPPFQVTAPSATVPAKRLARQAAEPLDPQPPSCDSADADRALGDRCAEPACHSLGLSTRQLVRIVPALPKVQSTPLKLSTGTAPGTTRASRGATAECE